ncbi:hypothetical protein ACOSQ2_003972 [Xanthoceras sorbifolium]
MKQVVQLLCLEVEWCCDGCCGWGLDQGLGRSIWAVRGLVVLEVLQLCMGIAALIVCGLSGYDSEFVGAGSIKAGGHSSDRCC